MSMVCGSLEARSTNQSGCIDLVRIVEDLNDHLLRIISVKLDNDDIHSVG